MNLQIEHQELIDKFEKLEGKFAMKPIRESFNNNKIIFIKSFSESCQCPICYNSLISSTVSLGCGHVFCKKCSVALKECPACRKPVDSKTNRDIYFVWLKNIWFSNEQFLLGFGYFYFADSYLQKNTKWRNSKVFYRRSFRLDTLYRILGHQKRSNWDIHKMSFYPGGQKSRNGTPLLKKITGGLKIENVRYFYVIGWKFWART